MSSINNSKLDQSYNLSGGIVPPINANKSSDYYPFAYGGNITGPGAGVMGGFAPHDGSGANPGYYEPYKYRQSNAGAQVLKSGGESNFGQFNPKNTTGTNPTHAGYNANLSYRNINPARRSYAGTAPKMSGMYNEGYQNRPRDGFFFDERYINPVYNDHGNPQYEQDYNNLGKPITEEEKEATVAKLDELKANAQARLDDPETSEEEKNRLADYIARFEKSLNELLQRS